ncbi:MAG: DUF4831 family protein [Bacteroidales bacterium]|nr:DUF4831 family protein [Bacteroidales bacterium]
MNRRLSTLVALALAPAAAALAQDAMGTVSYALPKTTITFEVEAVLENFYAGPYAKYAQKYLGVNARQEDQRTCTLSAVKMTPYIEADQTQRYYVTPDKGALSFLSLTSQGLVAVSDGSFGNGSQWRFASQAGADFSDKGVSSNLTSEATTLFRGVDGNRVAVQQNMVVQKSLEQRAQEAAEMIFDLRKKRVQIVTGDTDATYSGEAMGAALAEIAALEKEYMSMFIGYSDFQTQKMKCDVVPEKDRKSQTYVAFRLSDTDGIVSSDNMSGKPYLLELTPQAVSPASGKPAAAKGAVAVYRIPAICSVKLTDGVNPILQDRVAVYQLGYESYFPISSK